MEKNKSCSICVINRPDPDKILKLSSKYDFVRLLMVEQDGFCLDDDNPSNAIAGRVDDAADPHSAHELLGI